MNPFKSKLTTHEVSGTSKREWFTVCHLSFATAVQAWNIPWRLCDLGIPFFNGHAQLYKQQLGATYRKVIYLKSNFQSVLLLHIVKHTPLWDHWLLSAEAPPAPCFQSPFLCRPTQPREAERGKIIMLNILVQIDCFWGNRHHFIAMQA